MRSTRVLAATAAALTVVSLGLAGCGSAGGSGGDSQKQALVDELMTQLGNDGSLSDTQKNCLRDQFNGFSVDELTQLKNSTTDTDVPKELQDKVINAVMGCVMPSDSASPAAS